MGTRDIQSKLPLIKVGQFPSDEPDDITRASLEDLQSQHLEVQIDNLKESIALSNFLAKAVFGLVVAIVLLVFVIVIWQGARLPELRFSDAVLIALITSGPVNVIGVLYLVIKYVFHFRLKTY